MTITLHQLKVFVAAAKRLNLSKTAQTLNVTQAAVSHAIKEVEHLLDIKLIKKARSGIELTEMGESFSASVAKVLYDLNEVIQKHSRKKNHRSLETPTVGASRGSSSR